MNRRPVKKFTISINKTKEEIEETPKENPKKPKNDIEDIIKYRRTITQFKSPSTPEEMNQINQFLQELQQNQSIEKEITIRMMSTDEIQEMYHLQSQPKFNVILLSSNEKTNKKRRICIDIMNRIELFSNSKMLFGYWDKNIYERMKHSMNINDSFVFAYCFGHPLQKFIRFAPRPSPSIVSLM